mmetsp:Transcript_93/g.125  ORF Transcript_93/g.125 Transcript_93/m.125 type:complete len:345 (+) Transcript_93:110-1144(+)
MIQRKPRRCSRFILLSILSFSTAIHLILLCHYGILSDFLRIDFLSTQNNVKKDVISSSTHFDSFNETNPHLNSWCPNATCHNSPLCAPCNQRFLFIVSTGRSGSTTLLTLLNQLPNVRLSGENNGQLHVLANIESNIKSKLQENHDINQGPFLHNSIPSQAMACPMQEVMYTINPPPHLVQESVNVTDRPSILEYDKNKIFGCKTIRLQRDNFGKKPQSVATFFKRNFPCSKFVINYSSNVAKQAQSQQQYLKKVNELDLDSIKETIKKEIQFLRDFKSHFNNQVVRIIDFNKWSKNITKLNFLVEWMGFKNCQLDRIPHENHNGFKKDGETVVFGPQCQFPTH